MHTKRLLRISRPRFWIYEIGPYAVGIAAAIGLSGHLWILTPLLIFFVFFSYPANIYIYGINDIFDYETDKLNPKKVLYESLVVPSEHRKLFYHIAISCIPFLIYSYYIGSLHAFLALLAFFFFAGMYSALPIRAKAKPFLDSFFSAGHYIATAVFGYLLASNLTGQNISWNTLWISTIAGICWAMAMHAYSAVPDIKADAEANLQTIATWLQKRGTLILCTLLYISAGLLVFPFLGFTSLVLSLIYVVFMIISLNTTEEQLFRIYTYFPYINTLAGMTIFFLVALGQ
jgi:4-hydroxybenzoate polyprenyltransferase